MKKIPKTHLLFSLLTLLFLSSCYKNISVEKDVGLGTQTSVAIHSDPKKYPLLNRNKYPVTYRELTRVINNILESPEIQYRNVFKYDSITIINNDKIINAFCTPGGYIFVYTGLIKMAKNEDQLAAVIGHEIGHAELRHSLKKIRRSYGRQAIIITAAATAGAAFGVFIAVEIANKILGLGLSRDQEDHADFQSVKYLGTTKHYSSSALADFFEILLKSGKDVNIPPIISTHPDTRKRIVNVRKYAKKLNYSIDLSTSPNFSILVNSLPK